MIHLSNIHPLTDFKRNTSAFRSRLKRSGQPEVLTIEGRPELVVQDAEAYQRLLDSVEHAETISGIREGLESMDRGGGTEAGVFFKRLRKQLRARAKKKT